MTVIASLWFSERLNMNRHEAEGHSSRRGQKCKLDFKTFMCLSEQSYNIIERHKQF